MRAKFALFPGVTNPHGPCDCLKLVYGGNTPPKVTNQTGIILYTDSAQTTSTSLLFVLHYRYCINYFITFAHILE